MKERDPITATLLSVFVPFYIIYWFYDTGKQLDAKGAKVPSGALLLAPALLSVLLFVIIIGGAALSASEGMVGVFILLVLFPALLVLTLMYFYRFGAAVEKVTSRALTKSLLFILFWFVAPAGIFLTQEKLNDLVPLEAPASTSDNPPRYDPVLGATPKSDSDSSDTTSV